MLVTLFAESMALAYAMGWVLMYHSLPEGGAIFALAIGLAAVGIAVMSVVSLFRQ